MDHTQPTDTTNVGYFDLLGAARRVKVGSAPKKATLMAILERIGEQDQEWVCWPSTPRIAAETEQGLSTVKRHIVDLIDAGWIERRIRANPGGGRTGSLYVVPLAPYFPALSQSPDRHFGPPSDQDGDEAKVPLDESQSPADEIPSLYRSTKEVPTTSTPQAATKKGSRLADQFSVTDEMWAWAERYAPNVDARDQTARFCDYWRSESGPRAIKLDWTATWRNWIRTAAERSGRPGSRGPHPTDVAARMLDRLNQEERFVL